MDSSSNFVKKIEVKTDNDNVSPVLIGNGLIIQLKSLIKLDQYSKIFVLTESIIKENLFHLLQQGIGRSFAVIEVPSGETTKEVAGISSIWQELVDGRADRKSLLINFGGGMITDLGGFAASTYMRGIDFVNIPTTLLAQVDASIGGKNGINFSGIKNCIGTFNQAKTVIVDVAALQTLPQKELSSGMAEVIKHGVVFDEEYLKKVESLPDLASITPDIWNDIVFRSCQIKNEIVSKDEKESGVRKLLNFGHTAGHAIESLSHQIGKPLLHGEAIAIGMVIEARLSMQVGLTVDKIERLISVLQKFNLPTTLSKEDYPFDQLYQLIQRDKKNNAGTVSWTLLPKIGHGLFDQQVSKDFVFEALIQTNILK